MLKVARTKRFEKDIKRIKKQGKDTKKLRDIIELIVMEKELPLRCKDHNLTGNYNNRRECHIQPDWLLIYKIEKDTVIFERTGSHSDLFNKIRR